MKFCLRLSIAALLLSCWPGASFAHSVYIFAWVDGAQICTESYFTRESKVRGGEVSMTGANGDVLGKGVTGEDGLLCFPLPAKVQALDFTVLAGSGHKGGFRLEEKDLAGTVSAKLESETVPALAGPQTAVQPQPVAVLKPGDENFGSAGGETPPLDVGSDAHLRSLVREELQKQLSPLRQYLAEKFEDKSPGLREIVGGIGWLAGLGAFGFWCSQRRKKQ